MTFDPDINDRIRIDIPDTTDPDHDEYHGRHGIVDEMLKDDAEDETGDSKDSAIYRIKFDDGTESDFRWRDLRPPIDE